MHLFPQLYILYCIIIVIATYYITEQMIQFLTTSFLHDTYCRQIYIVFNPSLQPSITQCHGNTLYYLSTFHVIASLIFLDWRMALRTGFRVGYKPQAVCSDFSLLFSFTHCIKVGKRLKHQNTIHFTHFTLNSTETYA